jgi:hypothetical protein
VKLIPLTQGKFAKVDDSNFEWLNQWKWQAHKNKNNWYATRATGSINGIQGHVKMHRLILGLTDPNILIDHEDGDGLNNQEYNLRICDYAQNSTNRRNRKRISPVGVHKRAENQFRAMIRVKKKLIHLGTFKDESAAAQAYNKAAIKYYGEFANLNKI